MNSTTTKKRNTLSTPSALTAALLSTLLVPALLLSGCFSSPEPACAFSCGQGSVCPDNYRCVSDGWCKRSDVADSFSCSATPLLDAAAGTDGTVTDAPPVDAMVTDAMVTDALPDAALPDAALPDAALPDAALPDAALPDAALPDAALPDAA